MRRSLTAFLLIGHLVALLSACADGSGNSTRYPDYSGAAPRLAAGDLVVRVVDTAGKPTTRIDFAEATEGLESPWGMAQLTFFGDGGAEGLGTAGLGTAGLGTAYNRQNTRKKTTVAILARQALDVICERPNSLIIAAILSF